MATEGRERFGDFDRDDFAKETTIFSEAGHYRLGNIRRMQDNARTFLSRIYARRIPRPTW